MDTNTIRGLRSTIQIMDEYILPESERERIINRLGETGLVNAISPQELIEAELAGNYIRNPLRDCSDTMAIHFPGDDGRPVLMSYPEDDSGSYRSYLRDMIDREAFDYLMDTFMYGNVGLKPSPIVMERPEPEVGDLSLLMG